MLPAPLEDVRNYPNFPSSIEEVLSANASIRSKGLPLNIATFGQIQLALQYGVEILDLKRLLQNRPFGMMLRHAGLPISGCENEMAPARSKEIGDRIDLLRADIDVEEGDIDLRPGKIFLSFGDLRERRADTKAEFFQHVVDEHRNERLILDNENAGLRWAAVIIRWFVCHAARFKF
jgi:hypothetical protein